MKNIICLTLAVIVLSAVIFAANDFGLGIIIGEPTGISAKYWTGNATALDAAVAWSFSGEDKFHLHADYLFHSISAYDIDNVVFDLYYGGGIRIRFTDETELGIRIPLGTSYSPGRTPIDVFFELVPVMNIIPDTKLDINAGIGVRYYF